MCQEIFSNGMFIRRINDASTVLISIYRFFKPTIFFLKILIPCSSPEKKIEQALKQIKPNVVIISNNIIYCSLFNQKLILRKIQGDENRVSQL